ncbi:hypothetical protein PLESTB_001859100 [Pleodorina starrii]|uniref:Uncharacterized protein n=1 Tax=Pleodorina starrii TaxID=330485 RepID=A0A9W6FAA0_9CHLO|nr:hypothetical protein PLESTM_000594200 [Pleodorina starrii]GLC62232.1 hypothetical protein PLESTB_001859100 [Pleodorina starrii]GLC74046.1 hypothetical protein PLESTF_001454100 [Pleodorina starrii]
MSRQGGTCVSAPALDRRLELLSQLYKDNENALAVIRKLHELIVSSGDDFRLREGIHAVVELLLEAKLGLQELALRVDSLERLATSRQKDRQKLAVRQVLYNFNEKILRKVMELLHINAKIFWTRYPISNFGAMERHPDLMAVWPEVRECLGLDGAATPKALWNELKVGRERMGNFVHAENVDKLSYEELKLGADGIFVGDIEFCKDIFFKFLDLSVKIGGDLYEV